jgi:hypothetical protein
MSGEFPTQLGDEFTKYVAKIISNLGIEGANAAEIVNKMNIFNDAAKFKIINDSELKEHLNALEKADQGLKKLVLDNGELNDFYNNGRQGNKEAWDESMKQIAILQGLIILRKISQNDCDGLIKNLLKSFDTKLKAVNELLSSDLIADKDGKQTTSPVKDTTSQDPDTTSQGQGLVGGSDYLVKYLKYKNKYLKLLKNNM